MGREVKINRVEELRKGRIRPTAVFMEFTQYKALYNTSVFAFYEGEDGKYYDHRIRQYCSTGTDLVTFKMDGKDAVKRIMEMISKDSSFDNVATMFFIDRDMDFDLPHHPDLYITPCYSIENLYANENVLHKILVTEFGFNKLNTNYKKTMELFREFYGTFCIYMAEFNALVLLQNENSKKQQTESQSKTENKICIQDVVTMKHLIKMNLPELIEQSSDYQSWINKFKNSLQVQDSDIEDAKQRLTKYGYAVDVFRGKNQLEFFSAFVEQLVDKKKQLFTPTPKCLKLKPNADALDVLSQHAETPPQLIEFIKKHCEMLSMATNV